MRLWEILQEDETSPYYEEMKSELINYLTSLAATGAETPVSTEKVVKFMKRLGYDVTPAQVADMLDDTTFDASEEEINVNTIRKQDDEDEVDRENDDKKVSHMAKRELEREM